MKGGSLIWNEKVSHIDLIKNSEKKSLDMVWRPKVTVKTRMLNIK